MGIFEYEEPDSREIEEDDDEPRTVRVCDNGDQDYTNFRMTVPKGIAEKIGMEPGDHVKVESTDDGFKATVMDL